MFRADSIHSNSNHETEPLTYETRNEIFSRSEDYFEENDDVDDFSILPRDIYLSFVSIPGISTIENFGNG